MKTPTFELLEVLLTVSESSNFAEAGVKLGLSQPGVTQKLQRLASEVPFPLFQVQGKRKIPTLFAQELCKIIKDQRNALAENYEELNRKFSSGEFLTLRVGGRREITEILAESFLFEGKTEFRYLSAQAAIDQLQAHEIDVAISHRLPDSLHLTAKKITRSGCRIAVHEKFLKGHSKSALYENKEFFKEVPCVIYHTDGHLLSDLLAYLGLTTRDIKVKVVTEDWRTLLALIEGGHGVGVFPDYLPVNSASVHCQDIPEKIIPKTQFYSVFAKDLKKIKGFKTVAALQ